MTSPKWLWVAPFAALAVSMGGAQLAHAEPLSPLTPGEEQFLAAIREVYAVKHDPTAARSDGELLTRGEFVCDKAHGDQIGAAVTFQSPALTQLALKYLCP